MVLIVPQQRGQVGCAVCEHDEFVGVNEAHPTVVGPMVLHPVGRGRESMGEGGACSCGHAPALAGQVWRLQWQRLR